MPNTIAQNLTRLANAKEAIAEAIEAKGVTLGENDGFEDFADAIMEISSGGTSVLITKSITANNTYDAIDDGADGYSSVTVNVPPVVQIEEFSLGTLTPNTYIDVDNGQRKNWDGESSTDFIEVDSDHYYAFSGDWGTHGSGAWDANCNAQYDANRQYISGLNFSGAAGRAFILLSFGSNVKYIRVSQATELFTTYKTKVYKIPKSAMPQRGT